MRSILAFAMWVWLAGSCGAAVLTVNHDGSADYLSISEAIVDAEAGDVIEVAAGVYVETIVLPCGVELQGEIIGGEPNDTIIDGGGAGTVITMQSCDASTQVQGFTVRNGTGTEVVEDPNPATIVGGGILLINSSAVIRDCIISGNTADMGGGLGCMLDTGSEILNCEFADNAANIFGGGMACYASGPVLEGCTFVGNECLNDGGGLFVWSHSTPTVRHCTFEGNTADDDGGGAYSWDYSCCTVEDCVFRGNYSGDKAGGFYGDAYDTSTLTRCLFVDNEAGYYGGAMYLFDNASVEVSQCRFLGNYTNNSGGAIRCYSECTLTAVNCVFHYNHDWGWGGAVECRNDSHADLANCTFVHNFSMVGGAVALRDDSTAVISNCILWDNNTSGNGDQLSAKSSELTVEYCVVEGGQEDIYNEDGLGVIHYDTATNLTSDPLLIDGNGPDDTFGTEDDNPRLDPDSPCVDTGHNASVPAGVVSDLDGYLRIVDGDCNGSLVVDMGAHELNHAAYGDFDGHCDTNLRDVAILAAAWLSGPLDDSWNPMCNLTDAGDAVIDLADLGVMFEHWLWNGQ